MNELQQQILVLEKTSAELLEQLRTQSTVKRQDLIVKLKERDTELQNLKHRLALTTGQEMEVKTLTFHLATLRAESAKLLKRAERSEKESEQWRQQVALSLQLVEQVQQELLNSKQENALNAKRMKKRLVVKSTWFRSQLIKLDRLVDLCMQMDSLLSPELTCPVCLELMKYPQSLFPCGHSQCGRCVNESKNHANSHREKLTCVECHREVEMTTPNYICKYNRYR